MFSAPGPGPWPVGPGPGPMGPGPSEELFVGYQQLRAGCRCRAEGLFASRDLGSLIISDLGPPVEFGSPSPFANLPFSFEPFPSRLNTSWFVGTADGINTAEVVMKVGGYDGGFEARGGGSFFRRTSLLSALGPNGPGQMGPCALDFGGGKPLALDVGFLEPFGGMPWRSICLHLACVGLHILSTV